MEETFTLIFFYRIRMLVSSIAKFLFVARPNEYIFFQSAKFW